MSVLEGVGDEASGPREGGEAPPQSQWRGEEMKAPRAENRQFLRVLFPPIERFRDCIGYANLLIYGHQGFGKTETWKWLVQKATEIYGPKNVNACMSKDIKLLLEGGINPRRPVQLLIAEDLTLQRVDNQALQNFYTIRHVAESEGLRSGYILTVLVIHDLYALPKHLRTFFQFLIATNPPTNRFDFNVLKGYLRAEVIRTLERLSRHKHLNDSYKAWKAFWYLGKSGFLRTELVKIKVRETDGWLPMESGLLRTARICREVAKGRTISEQNRILESLLKQSEEKRAKPRFKLKILERFGLKRGAPVESVSCIERGLPTGAVVMEEDEGMEHYDDEDEF
jgi:hypothetical protein